MKLTKATCQYSILENGDYVFEVHAQWDDYLTRSSFPWCPQTHVLAMSPKIFHQWMALLKKSVNESGFPISYLSNPSAPPYFNTTSPTTTPQHRLVLDSSTLNQRGCLEFSRQSFGAKPSQSIFAFIEYNNLLAKIAVNNFSSLVCEQGDHLQFSIVVDCYDLRATQFFVPKCGRVWRLERTMTRTLTRELEQLIGGVIPRYKGVRWRPERKHPWVAEIKISEEKSKKKMWIGNFATPEEAARAYDAAVIRYKKQMTLNFEDSCKDLSNSTMWSIIPSDQSIAIDKSFEVSTSQSMPLGTRTCMGEPSEQARAMPTCGLVNQGGMMIPLVTQADIQPKSKDIITSEKYPPLKVVGEASQEVDTYNKSFEMVENGYKSYFMFASDLPSMGGACSALQKTSSSSDNKVYDKQTDELLVVE
jgi:hypothetical protein